MAAQYSEHAVKILERMWEDGLYDDRNMDDFVAAIADIEPRMVQQWYQHKRFETLRLDQSLPSRVPYVDRKIKHDTRMRGVGSGRGPRTAYSPEQTSILTIALHKGYLDDKVYVELTARIARLTKRQVGQWRNNRRFQEKQRQKRKAEMALKTGYYHAAKRQRSYYPVESGVYPRPDDDYLVREHKLMSMLHNDVKQGVDMTDLTFVMKGTKLSPAIQLILERAFMNNMMASAEQQKIVATLAGITEYDVRRWFDMRANTLLSAVKPTEVDLLSENSRQSSIQGHVVPTLPSRHSPSNAETNNRVLELPSINSNVTPPPMPPQPSTLPSLSPTPPPNSTGQRPRPPTTSQPESSQSSTSHTTSAGGDKTPNLVSCSGDDSSITNGSVSRGPSPNQQSLLDGEQKIPPLPNRSDTGKP